MASRSITGIHMNVFKEPEKKHYGLVGGVAIAVLLGLIRGTRMQAESRSDFIALLIAFAIIVAVFGGIGFAIDTYLNRRNKKLHRTIVEQDEDEKRFGEFNYDYEEKSNTDSQENQPNQ